MSDWIFGYGSPVWRPDFPAVERAPAAVEGWARRFWQGSTDHRGVPGAPGRVVTLAPAPGARCWGMAYRVAPEARSRVLDRLAEREKGGYDRVLLDLAFAEPGRAPVAAHVFRARGDNPNFLGPAPLPEIAAQVARSRGPSGANAEYVLRLAAALRALGVEDDHVFSLERLVIDAAAA